MSLFPRTINYTVGTGSWVNGRWVESAVDVLFFYGNCQPVVGKEFESLAAGRENTGLIKIYSDRVLPISTIDGTTPGAIVVWDEKKWEVIKELPYKYNLIPHRKYIAQWKEDV